MSKAAGTRLFALALTAAAALVVFGCGGDSATKTASTPSSSSKTSSSSSGSGGAKESSSSKQNSGDSKSSVGQGGGEGAGGSESADSAKSTAGKQGPTIAPPKGPRERETSAQERAEATVVSISLESPALAPGPESVSVLPATYTCDGKDTWPELKWGGVPAGTEELVLTVLSLEPVGEALFFNWAVGGLDPGLTELKSGALPKGAVVGKNSFGKIAYSICPPKSSTETYIFTLYALPKRLAPQKGFDPAALRKEALGFSANAGILATSYTRG